MRKYKDYTTSRLIRAANNCDKNLKKWIDYHKKLSTEINQKLKKGIGCGEQKIEERKAWKKIIEYKVIEKEIEQEFEIREKEYEEESNK